MRGLTKVLRPFWRMRRGLTLGAQGAVIDGEAACSWCGTAIGPAGCSPAAASNGARRIETALARELEEEVGVTLTGPAQAARHLLQFRQLPGDHIAVFVVRHWERRDDYRKRGEIAEAGMFARRDLPERDRSRHARAARRDFRPVADQPAAGEETYGSVASRLVILATWWPWKLARLSSFCDGRREPSGAAMVPAP